MLDIKVEMPKEVAKKISRFTDTLQAYFENQTLPRTVPIAMAMPRIASQPATKEEKKDRELIEKFIEGLEPEIQKHAYKMVKEQIHQLLLMGGNRRRIVELLKLGKIPKLIRKKEGPRRDPLYLQFGDGVEEPIEEIYILG